MLMCMCVCVHVHTFAHAPFYVVALCASLHIMKDLGVLMYGCALAHLYASVQISLHLFGLTLFGFICVSWLAMEHLDVSMCYLF